MQKLLFLHGAIGSKQQFSPLAEALKGTFDVWLLNFSGHGGEPLTDENFRISVFANDVLSWMEKSGIEKIDIFGYNMGGYVALYLARHHPQRVGKIFTLATKLKWNEEIAVKEANMLIPEVIRKKVPAFADVLEKRHAPQNWKKVLAKTAEMMINLGKENALEKEDYQLIENKVHIGIGDRDKMVTQEETIEVYRLLKNASFAILPDTPHPIEQVPVSKLSMEISAFFSK